MKLYAKLLMGLLALGMPAMYAVNEQDSERNIALSNKLATPVDVVVITTTGAFGKVQVAADNKAKLTIREQYDGDGIGLIAYLSVKRQERNKTIVNVLKSTDVTTDTTKTINKFPKNEKEKVNTRKLKGLESLTFKYERGNFTIEGVRDNGEPVKLLP